MKFETASSGHSEIAVPESGAPFNPVEDVIYRRRSVRLYKKKQVPEYLVRRVIEAGRFAPSTGNSQPWKFIVIQDQKMIKDMTDHIVKSCQSLVKMTDYFSKPGTGWRERIVNFARLFWQNEFHPNPLGAFTQIAEGKLGVWHGAPTVIIILIDQRAPSKPLIDVGVAGQNMVLSAHSMGLGTCWVGFVEFLSRSYKWRKRLNIKSPYRIANSIAIGYPKGTPDGYVKRETKAIDWYDENGQFSIKY
ncbi:MAG: nitroreductase [Proteobacteria bacterium]|nr:nitroreductase [Pseudomonadota bacterium]